MYELILEPVGRGRFQASYNGEVIVASAKEPFLAGARVLLTQGADPGAALTSRWKSGSPSMSSTVGAAAALMVVERSNSGRSRSFELRPWRDMRGVDFGSEERLDEFAE